MLCIYIKKKLLLLLFTKLLYVEVTCIFSCFKRLSKLKIAMQISILRYILFQVMVKNVLKPGFMKCEHFSFHLPLKSE